MACDEKDIDPCKKLVIECSSSSCNPIFLREVPAGKLTKALCNELVLTPQQLENYMKNFTSAMKMGLRQETHPQSIVKCFPTYVQHFPDGTESGTYLALDLGGSTFRVLLVKFEEGEYEIDQNVYEINEDVMTGPGEQLFDFIAESIATFAQERDIAEDNLPLGFTFNFPFEPKGLKVGILQRWTKGFSCSGVIGNDVVQLLDDAIHRRDDVKVNIVAVISEITGTMMTCAFKDQDCKIGVIVDTGANECYVEQQYNAELFDAPNEGSGVVVINMESGAFGDGGELEFCRTQYDKDVDKSSINPGEQLHEKMISGMYLGELVRLAVVRFANEGIMFNGTLSQKFKTPGSFEPQFLSEIESDDLCTYENVTRICEELELDNATEEDYRNLRFICSKFSKRAAHLLASSIVVLIRKMNYRKTTIGIDGDIYKNHPHFHNILMHKIQEMLIPDTYKFNIVPTEDGSGVGAALVAAVIATSVKKPKKPNKDDGEGGGEEGEGGGEEGEGGGEDGEAGGEDDGGGGGNEGDDGGGYVPDDED